MTRVRLVGQLAFAEQPVVEPGQVAFHVIAPGFAIEYAVTLARVHVHFYRLAMRLAVGEVLQSGDEALARPRWLSLQPETQQYRRLDLARLGRRERNVQHCSEERREGQEGVSSVRCWWLTYTTQNKRTKNKIGK